MDEPRKLARGLKDVSALFGDVSSAPCERRSPEIQMLAVSTPDCEGDSLLLNAFFASQVAMPERTCSLLSVLSRANRGFAGTEGSAFESLGQGIHRYGLYWDELRSLLNQPPAPPAAQMLQSRDIFLDFEYRYLFHCERTVALLDKWVLVLKPTVDSLTEGYKMMKVGLAINPQLEFYVTLSGKTEEAAGGIVFERFSDFVERHLKVPLAWLGWLDLSDPARHFSANLQTELLKYQPWNPKPCLQKFMVAGWIESMEQSLPVDQSLEVAR